MKTVATEVFTIEQFKQEFCEIQSIRDHWESIEKLLRAEIFRASLREYNGSDPRKNDMENLCDKLVVGAIGFLWCKGTREEKAEFLFDLSYIPSIRKKAREIAMLNNSISPNSSTGAGNNLISFTSGNSHLHYTEATNIYHSNKNLRFLFHTFFTLSIEFPKEMLESPEFIEVDIFDKAEIEKNRRWRRNLAKEPE